ncbi:flagellar basal body rod protein FlgB [Acetohalobium arabaticum]|uniref:Flagellar basal body rod protein FlgB n=1 Tax=Acetohalobium arabaticum (strain ATCC 49924 / DSM 5501 / Z-7288) TaxID=574087 RepID=D9QRL3_ACEAZ|nr:flagellar basal body rod protein FlgB [Acetohalobium arabaticum]ADL13154.1 flagellar basal-body rod protein FlgB [Acetohalobium arabaticum DSM 5501]
MDNITGNQSISVLTKALDGLQQRQEAISNNIANVDTPDYKRKDVNFKSELKTALNNDSTGLTATHKNHFSTNSNLDQLSLRIKTDSNTKMRSDQNNVDIDREMSILAKNGLEYQAVTRMLSMEFDQLSSVINKVK